MLVGRSSLRHSDHASIGIKDGNINVDAHVADGLRVGDSKVIADQGGHASVPVIDVVVPGASVAKSIVHSAFPHW